MGVERFTLADIATDTVAARSTTVEAEKEQGNQRQQVRNARFTLDVREEYRLVIDSVLDTSAAMSTRVEAESLAEMLS